MPRPIPRESLAALVDWLDRHAPSAIVEWRALCAGESVGNQVAAQSAQMDLGASLAEVLDQAERAGLLAREEAA